MPRWSKILLAIVSLVIVGAGVAVAVVWNRLPQIVAERASKATGRRVQIGSLTVSPGRWIGFELRDASLANLAGGTRPQMATLGRLSGEVEFWPLLHGTVIARAVRVERADILLERVGEQPNWRNGPKRPAKAGGGRAGFPTLLDAALDGVVTFRTATGHDLVTKLDGVKLETAAADQPARLTGPGSYRDAPLQFDMKLGSYDQLHDAATPFPADITLTSGDTTLHFVGTMTKPLEVDGGEGQLQLVAPTPDVLEKIIGIDPKPAPPLRLEGALEHEAPRWTLQQAKGALGDAEVEDGTLQFLEGSVTPPKVPDRLGVDLRFATIDADRLMAAFEGGAGSKGGGFVPAAAPNPEITAKVQASLVTYEKMRFTKAAVSLAVAPKLVTLDNVSFGALGGEVRLDARIEAEPDGKTGAVSATVAGTGLEVAALSQAVGAGHLPLAGKADVHAVADGVGATASAALKAGHAAIVATMQGGRVSVQLIELASTDVSGFLSSSRTMVGLECLLASAELRGGVATIGTARLRSTEGTIVARGQVDPFRQTLDVVVASEARTTGALALDVPMRVSGAFADPSIAPAGSAAGRSALATGAGIAGPLRAYAQRSRCAR